MKIYVKINRTEAIKRGSEVYGSQVVDVALEQFTVAQREALAALPTDYQRQVDASVPDFTAKDIPELPEITGATVGALLDAIPEILHKRKEKAEAEQKQKEADLILRIERWLEKPETESFYPSLTDSLNTNYKWLPDALKEQIRAKSAAMAKEKLEQQAQRNKEATDKAADKAAAERKAKEEQEQQEQAITLRWAEILTKVGSENQRERWDAGFLDLEIELRPVWEDHLFASLAEFPPYVKIRHNECCTDDCQCREYRGHPCPLETKIFTSGFSIPAEAWNLKKSIESTIRAQHPTATVVIREHNSSVSCCDGTMERLGIYVSLQDGPLTFSREFAA